MTDLGNIIGFDWFEKKKEAGLPDKGFEAVQIAVRLFQERQLGRFKEFMRTKAICPNIILMNGATLLQESIKKYPKDIERLSCLLALGADPNFIVFSEDGQTPCFLPPLDLALGQYPEKTTEEMCRLLRQYGADCERISAFDKEPTTELLEALREQRPEPSCVGQTRTDMNSSLRERLLVSGLEEGTLRDLSMMRGACVTKNRPTQDHYTVAQEIFGKGVYLGRWKYKGYDEDGRIHFYNVFAAPTPLLDAAGKLALLSHAEAIAHIEAMRENAHGHNGAGYKTTDSFWEALNSGLYNGSWVMPYRHVLEMIAENSALVERYASWGAKECWSLGASHARPASKWVLNIVTGAPELKEGRAYQMSCIPVRFEPALS